MSHYAYVVAFSLIIIGLLRGRFKAMHVFAAPVLLLILSGFMGVKQIYATAVNPSILTVMGPGNYSNLDFLKLGVPVLLVYSLSVLYAFL